MVSITSRKATIIYISYLICLYIGPVCLGASVLTDRKGSKPLERPEQTQSFTFAILADVTDQGPNNLEVLKLAVHELNIISPDLIFTIGDMVQGYCDRPTWLRQWDQVRQILNQLTRPLFPVAGNHDIYWSSNQPRPPGEHEADYEQHIGPLWYAFQHKGCWFIALYTDEGDPNTGKKSFSDPNAQRFSRRQADWLRSILDKAKGANHIFVFMHHPRWITAQYGQDWENIHPLLRKAGVSAVFGGHHHILQFDGVRDGIRYYRLGTTGGAINRDVEPQGFHHYLLVTVRAKQFSVATVRVGSVFSPEDPVFRRYMLLERTQWRIPQERAVDFQVMVPQAQQARPILQVAVGHSWDAYGDRGLQVQVLEDGNEPILTRFLSDRRTVWVECPVSAGKQYTIRLSDQDTRFDTSAGPNTGTIAARLRFELQPTAW